ncbi:carboxypeptidase regulatory-like domain-containing protein [Hymenobacter sp. BT559]|uniref:carboxypeptidase regulatory-like domain-containing protein n=1 Tax=Hymenobacter sp. BT559 TaxID=2795729 RepID=UPI0018EC0A7F|nr:carboxypeptidase regulatory-like domain-containing protein [Hymenobacter sp. BT559]MBJ6143989.1 carboxypeptidase regulatory-like domain-containing protein [Hymenobacter sp. BT559]
MKTALRLLAAWGYFWVLAGLGGCEPVTVEPTSYGELVVTVLDSGSGQPLANTGVSTSPASGSFVTDARGQATLAQVPAGTLAVSARRNNYTTLTTNVTVTAGSTQAITLLLDKATAAAPPDLPARPTPASGATGQPTTVTLSWHPTGATKSDSLTYDVALFEGNATAPRLLLSNSRDSSVVATGLRYGTIYFWQVTVRKPNPVSGGNALTTLGRVWSFQTSPFPDNRYVYVRTVNDITDIYSSDAAGTSVVQLTQGQAVEAAPQFNPSRDLIAYASNATGQWQLYTMNLDGTDKQRITTLSAEGYSNNGVGYRWSPDGAQLIYAHYNQLYRINRDGTGLTLLATAPANRHFRECDWTVQNGGRLVVQTIGSNVFDSELYLLNVDGSNSQLLLGNLPGRLDSPSFSTDGLSVAYTHDAAGFNDPGGRQLDARVYTLGLTAGATPVDVSGTATSTAGQGKPLGTNDLLPRYSPTSYSFIFVNVPNDNRSIPQVWTMSLDGRSRTQLFQNATQPDWK